VHGIDAPWLGNKGLSWQGFYGSLISGKQLQDVSGDVTSWKSLIGNAIILASQGAPRPLGLLPIHSPAISVFDAFLRLQRLLAMGSRV
jgi:hypothetical protein